MLLFYVIVSAKKKLFDLTINKKLKMSKLLTPSFCFI